MADVKTSDALLVDIAMLLDLRVGVISLMDIAVGVAMTQIPDYYLRTSEQLKLPDGSVVEASEVIEVLKAHPAEVLRHSPMTACTCFLREFYYTQALLKNSGPHTPVDKLVVNTYPYSLSGEQQVELALCLKHHLDGVDVHVRVISQAYTELTEAVVKSNYAALLLYDPTEWLEANAEVLKGTSMQNLTLYTPRLARIRDLTKSEKAQLKQHGQLDPFEIITEVFKGHLNFNYIDADLACVYTPLNPAHIRASVESGGRP